MSILDPNFLYIVILYLSLSFTIMQKTKNIYLMDFEIQSKVYNLVPNLSFIRENQIPFVFDHY